MKYKVTIEPRFAYASGLLSFFSVQKEKVVQGDTFKLGFKITNIGELPIKNILIKNIKINPADGVVMRHSFKKEFIVDLLNPKDNQTIWVSDFGTDLCGLAYLSLDIQPDKDGDIIETYQVNRFNSDEDKANDNSWVDFFYIKSSGEHTQENNNIVLVFLTLALLILGLAPIFNNVIDAYFESKAVETCRQGPVGVVTVTRGGVEVDCSEYLKLQAAHSEQ